MDKGIELVGYLVVRFESGVDVLHASEGVVSEAAIVVRIGACGFGRGLPFLVQIGKGKGTEANGPAFKQDDFYGGFGAVGAVDLFPLGFWDAVALAGEGGFVILWYACRSALGKGRED